MIWNSFEAGESSTLKNLQLFFIIFYFLLISAIFRSQLINLSHHYRNHKLAKFKHIWPKLRICCHAFSNYRKQHWAVIFIFIKWLIISINNFFSYCEWITSTKWLNKSHQFIDDASQGPNISFLSVGLWLDYFGTWIKNSSHKWFHYTSRLSTPLLCQSKVS